MKKRNFLFSGMIIFLVPFIFLKCSKSSYNNDDTGGTGNAASIYMKNSVFSSASVRIIAGGTVTWYNDDNMIHTVTADDGSFNSGDIQVNGSFSHTFNTIGTYLYHCQHHTGMTGTIIVAAKSK